MVTGQTWLSTRLRFAEFDGVEGASVPRPGQLGEAQGDDDKDEVEDHHEAPHGLGHLPVEGQDGDEDEDQHEEQQSDRAADPAARHGHVLLESRGVQQPRKGQPVSKKKQEFIKHTFKLVKYFWPTAQIKNIKYSLCQ